MELIRIGGCIQSKGILGLLFLEEHPVLPTRLVTECKHVFSKVCSHEKCLRYRIGTVGSHKTSWDKYGKRM
jgi:hypothetical protein